MKKYYFILLGLLIILLMIRINEQKHSSQITNLVQEEEIIAITEIKETIEPLVQGEIEIGEAVTDNSSQNDLNSLYAFQRDGTQVSIEQFNKMTLEELKNFTGIGEVTAQAILSYRNEKGQFASFDELINVKGIGQKKLDKLLNPSFD